MEIERLNVKSFPHHLSWVKSLRHLIIKYDGGQAEPIAICLDRPWAEDDKVSLSWEECDRIISWLYYQRHRKQDVQQTKPEA